MEYRVITEMDELERISQLQQDIWRSPEREMSAVVARVTVLRGGLVLGAYDDSELVGMLWAFPVRRGGHCALWSFVAGVLPEYRGRGVGFGLKQAQRRWALANDYDAIYWTFDPLRAQNANFNINVLGATVRDYHESVYGQMVDALNIGLPTDRYEATWELNSPRVVALAEGRPWEHQPPSPDLSDEAAVLIAWREGVLHAVPMLPTIERPTYYLEIPADFDTLANREPDTLLEWQAHLRRLSQEAFVSGYQVTGFARVDGHCWYVFTRSDQDRG